MLSREELAARFVEVQMIAAPNWARANCNPGTHEQFLEDAFKLADDFLAYAAKQPKKAAPAPDHDCDGYKCEHISHYPERCNHNWCSINGGSTHCIHCGAPKVKPEPPKPERVEKPREWAILIDDRGGVEKIQDEEYNHDSKMVRVREVLE